MKRILLSSLLALLTLASLSGVARADDITFSGVGPVGVFGPLTGANYTQQAPFSTILYTETQATPIANNLAFGSTASDDFTFIIGEPGALNNFITLTGTITAVNSCSGAFFPISGVGCSSLFVNATASDPGALSSLITMDVNQSFALASPLAAGSVSFPVPVSSSLVGSCSPNAVGSVSASTQFTSAGGTVTPSALSTLSSPVCTDSAVATQFFENSAPGFATITAGPNGLSDLNIDTQVSFSLIGGSISIPAGSCFNSTCVEPSLVPPASTPEPGTLVLMAIGLAGVGLLLKR